MDITKEEAQELREMARLAFRNSVGATEDSAISFNHRDYSTLDLNFLWHFKMVVEYLERNAIEEELLSLKHKAAGTRDYTQGRWDMLGEAQDVVLARGAK